MFESVEKGLQFLLVQQDFLLLLNNCRYLIMTRSVVFGSLELNKDMLHNYCQCRKFT